MTPEQKKESFQRLAPKRVMAVRRALKILGNCANTGSYEYTTEQVDQITVVLQADLDLLIEKFSTPEATSLDFGFSE